MKLFERDLFRIAVVCALLRGEEQNREEGEMAQKKLGRGRNRGEKVGRREKKKRNRLGRREKLAQKSREEGEIGSESKEKGDLPPCSPPLFRSYPAFHAGRKT